MDKNTKTRTDLLNHLVRKHGLKRYLEIGLQRPEQNFDKIECSYKISVDPDPVAHASFCMTSDEFFKERKLLTENTFVNDYETAQDILGNLDLIFIDGLHTAEQVKKDFENALKVLSPNGFIVLHDCNPLEEWHTIVPRPSPTGHWNGDVYKFACEIAMKSGKFCTVDIDNGMGVWDNSKEDTIPNAAYTFEPFIMFRQFKKELLNLITWDEFIATDSHV